jgi:hypothetical protein
VNCFARKGCHLLFYSRKKVTLDLPSPPPTGRRRSLSEDEAASKKANLENRRKSNSKAEDEQLVANKRAVATKIDRASQQVEVSLTKKNNTQNGNHSPEQSGSNSAKRKMDVAAPGNMESNLESKGKVRRLSVASVNESSKKHDLGSSDSAEVSNRSESNKPMRESLAGNMKRLSNDSVHGSKNGNNKKAVQSDANAAEKPRGAVASKSIQTSSQTAGKAGSSSTSSSLDDSSDSESESSPSSSSEEKEIAKVKSRPIGGLKNGNKAVQNGFKGKTGSMPKSTLETTQKARSKWI